MRPLTTVVEDPMTPGRHADRRRSRSARVVIVTSGPAAGVGHDADRRVGAGGRAGCAGPRPAARSAPRAGVVQADDQVGFGRGLQAALDDLPAVSRSDRLMATWSWPSGAPSTAAAAGAAVTPGTTSMSTDRRLGQLDHDRRHAVDAGVARAHQGDPPPGGGLGQRLLGPDHLVADGRGDRPPGAGPSRSAHWSR